MAYRYHSSKGPVPSVTTITKLYGEKDGLIVWANNQGLEGKTLQDARQATATPGSMTHERVDYFINGRIDEWDRTSWLPKFDVPGTYADACDKCDQAFDNFARWYRQNGMRLIAGEIELVSEEHQFGGRLDALGSSGGLCLSDWKTGGGGKIYADFLYQIAGYSILWNENFPDKRLDGGFHVIRFNRDEADFAHWHFQDLGDAREGFLMLRKMYEIHKRLKRRL